MHGLTSFGTERTRSSKMGVKSIARPASFGYHLVPLALWPVIGPGVGVGDVDHRVGSHQIAFDHESSERPRGGAG